MTKEFQPSVSIIVVNWNGRHLMDECLGALFSQTYLAREIILVDNNSTDSSVEYVRERFAAVKIVELPENRGFTGGNLAGFGAAKGEFIALINNDTRAEKWWLDHLIRPMINDERVGICASKLIIDGTDKIDSAGDGITSAGVGFKRGLWKDKSFYVEPEPVFGACAAAALYRSKMLQEIGFFDDSFFLNDEDADLNFRAQLAGWRCVYVPTAIVHHKVNASIGRLSDLSVYYHTRNLEFTWIKNQPTGLMLRFAHHKVMQEFGAFCYLCVRHCKWRAYLRAKRDVLRMFPLMWKKRKEIQGKRRVTNRYLKSIMLPLFSKELIRQKIRQFIFG